MIDNTSVSKNDGTLNSVEVRPGVSMLSVLPHLSYTPWHAFAEFVDNAIQSYQEHAEKILEIDGSDSVLKVLIKPDAENNSLTISDNAGGIAIKDFPRAFRTAEIPPNRNGLSEFGMGMKSAACWFGKVWRVRTSAIGEPIERTIEFNIPKIVKNNTESLQVKEREVPEDQHYTVIEIEQVRSIPVGRTKGKICQHLPDIYRSFLRDRLIDLRYDGESLKFNEPIPLKAPYYSRQNEPVGEEREWVRDIDFKFGNGQRCYGKVGLLAKGSTRYAGFSLFRRGRVIQGTADEKYRPASIAGESNSYAFQRVFGELHLDNLPVSHTKDGFRWDDDAESQFLDALRNEVSSEEMPLLQQAENFRSRAAAKRSQDIVKKAIDATAKAIEEYVGPVVSEIENSTDPIPDVPNSLETATKLASRVIEVHTGSGVRWEIEIDLCTDESQQNWIDISESRTDDIDKQLKRLTVRLGLQSPFMKKIVRIDDEDSIEPIIRLAAGFALAENLARAAGQKKVGYVRNALNRLLADSLSMH